jgi:hypothetical protein
VLFLGEKKQKQPNDHIILPPKNIKNPRQTYSPTGIPNILSKIFLFGQQLPVVHEAGTNCGMTVPTQPPSN